MRLPRLVVPLLWLLPATALAEDLAAVMVLQGAVSIWSADEGTRDAAVGVGLEAGDSVRTGEGAAVILHLRNNYLVRVDEDIELSVDDIVLLEAEPIELDAEAQLADLLYPEERQSMEGIDRAERVAGWHARLTAAYAPASTEGPEADDRGAGSGPAATTSGAVPSGSSTLEARDAEDLGLDDVLDESALEAIEEVVRQKVDRARKKRRTRSAAPEAPVESDEAAGAATPTGPDIAFIRKEFLSVGSLYDCFNEWADALPIPVERIEVHLRVRDGQVKRVIFDQGLTPPRCVRDGLEGREIGEVDGTYTFTLHLVHG